VRPTPALHATEPEASPLTPAFTLARRQGPPALGSLFELFAAVVADDLLDLPRLPGPLRGPVVTSLAVMMSALRRHAPEEPRTAPNWESAWMAQVGPEALRLVAPPGEPAFFQPPTGGTPAPHSWNEVSYQFVQKETAVKTLPGSDPEGWCYALLSAEWRQYGGVGRYAGNREGLTVVLPSADASIGSEIRTLAQAFAVHRPVEIGTEAHARCAADHLLWLRPWDKTTRPLPVSEVPFPCVDSRPVRLIHSPLGVRAVGYSVTAGRLAKEAQLEDPHVALIADGKALKPYRTVKGRRADTRYFSRTLFGEAAVRRPRILDETAFRFVRVCAIGTNPPAKTSGYWEGLFRASEGPDLFRLAPPSAEDRAADLGRTALETQGDAAGALRAALARLLAIDSRHDPQWGLVGTLQARLDEAVRTPLVEVVFERLQQPPDPVADRAAVLEVVVPAVVDAYRLAETAVRDPLQRARAEGLLRWRLRQLTGGQTLRPALTPLARQTYAVVRGLDEHLRDDDRVALRAMHLPSPPIEYWTLLARLPREQADDDRAEAVWRAVLQALGTTRGDGPSVGRVLAETGYSDDRMSRLLQATRGHLIAELQAAIGWAVSHRVPAVALWQLAALGLADALDDRATAASVRKRLAMDYVRGAAPAR